ncbi:nitroreductase family deazaflavin-dependent oxidoreductase [Nocardia sp. SYP-A9097]|uniref:nitroreductase/quinone reductase family protein n=1 Tax=Nocardia sp. SYP-A9097 TaxID=2663237 RepID=UPI00129AE2EE|nr:nitroreductase/quinone reductase family protein [Nocardia sp. SYP-A9097]MRH87788.1 nitroreductase family deazaflavin-dependent oxidoreductase [Nocardia sp. SYP-A9097]
MPSDRQLKTVTTIHRAVLKLSGGILGTTFKGMPTIRLTTIGRKSGRSHTVILTAPIIDGDTIVVVASRGGDPTDPAWLHNIRANTAVRVARGHGPDRPMTARVLSPGERNALWPDVIAAHPGYDDYQAMTTRTIPLVTLTPLAGAIDAQPIG